MQHFITLTRWSTLPTIHGRPILIQPERINYIWQSAQRTARTDELKKVPVQDRPVELVTWIDFGGGEDSGVQVCESPKEISYLINGFPPSRAPILQFPYINHRGETAKRTVTAERLEFLPNPGYGYPPGWFITGRDNARDATRSFSLNHIPLEETKGLVLNLRTSA